MTKFSITIVSDTVCPWCYIGKRQLDEAIEIWGERYPERKDEFVVVWKPFYLNPDMVKIGVDKTRYYTSKFGPLRTTQIYVRLTEIGNSLGINFKFGGKIGNTRDSHRVIALAGSKSSPTMQDEVVQNLFRAYFEEEQDITDKEVLVDCAVKAGLEEEEVRDMLRDEGGEVGEMVDREVEEAKGRGVSGVPDFLIQGKWEVGGAQSSEVFLGVFERVVRGEEVSGLAIRSR